MVPLPSQRLRPDSTLPKQHRYCSLDVALAGRLSGVGRCCTAPGWRQRRCWRWPRAIRREHSVWRPRQASSRTCPLGATGSSGRRARAAQLPPQQRDADQEGDGMVQHGEVEVARAEDRQGHQPSEVPGHGGPAIGNPLYVPWCLEGLAGVAAARGEWPRAARLCGARDTLRKRSARRSRRHIRMATDARWRPSARRSAMTASRRNMRRVRGCRRKGHSPQHPPHGRPTMSGDAAAHA
jgi:hypothetical protein